MFCKRGDSGRAGRGKLGKFASGRRLIFIFSLFYVTFYSSFRGKISYCIDFCLRDLSAAKLIIVIG